VSTDPLDDPVAIRSAGAEWLSLALLDARNHLLRTLAGFEAERTEAAQRSQAWQIAMRAAAWQGRWLLPRGGLEPPPADDTRWGQWMADTLDASLDRLAAPAADLTPFHQALLHEDRLGEQLAVLLHISAPPARAQRQPLWMPAQQVMLGGDNGPGVPFNEWGGQTVAVPEFEIDAQAVNWQQYAEFATDGGYDRVELWRAAGWSWLQDQSAAAGEARRAPRHVAQLAGGVLVQRENKVGLQRAAAGQAAMHVSRFEAEAWCCWAGRRLPTEAEWGLAAATAGSRGFAWGDVFEWMAGSARGWPGAGPPPAACVDLPPPSGSQGVLRGASIATRRRRHHPAARRFMPPGHDLAFCGFRSCAI
jgi:formylglycine-generating enzyme required for sulfatase activity